MVFSGEELVQQDQIWLTIWHKLFSLFEKLSVERMVYQMYLLIMFCLSLVGFLNDKSNNDKANTINSSSKAKEAQCEE